jgi:hypothetical protein
MTTGRPDDPAGMAVHTGKFAGCKALVVLGGPSGANWEDLRDKIRPDVLLTANGATQLPGVDYWLLAENMNYCHTRQGEIDRLAGFMHVLDPQNTAKTMLVSHRSWNLLEIYGVDKSKCVKIRRNGYELGEIPDDFTLRDYGLGLLAGGVSQSRGWKPGVRIRTGTVGMQLLHLAGILGCAEVHTIGFDLTTKHDDKHHWYEHPAYQEDRFRTRNMFTEYKGVSTQWWWLETAEYLMNVKGLFDKAGLRWVDHSDGLLRLKGLWCAT